MVKKYMGIEGSGGTLVYHPSKKFGGKRESKKLTV